MDDLKRAVYIEARHMIQDYECDFVCWALILAVTRILGVNTYEMTVTEERAFLVEFFPEFFDLYDGIAWYRENGYWLLSLTDEMDTLTSLKMVGPHEQWWSLSMGGPHEQWWSPMLSDARLAILDFIINNR